MKKSSLLNLCEDMVGPPHCRDSSFDCWHRNLTQISFRGLHQIVAAFEKKFQFVVKAQPLAVDTDLFEPLFELL